MGLGTPLRVPVAGLSALGATGWAQDWLGTPSPWWLGQAHAGLVQPRAAPSCWLQDGAKAELTTWGKNP